MIIHKIIVYAYTQKVYSCRQIERLIRENIPAMWLAAMQTPDYRTINMFRGVRMRHFIADVFESIILKLLDEGYISFANYFLDGTKIETNANRYTFVWKKATLTYKEKLKEKIRETIEQINEITDIEAKEIGQGSDFTELELEEIADALEEKVDELDKKIEENNAPNEQKEVKKDCTKLKNTARQIKEDFIPRMRKYDLHLKICGDRNSFAKTDPAATFMRMKEDHMKNGQLKPGYNVQMATENQFVLFYSIHQNHTDTRCFIPHLEKLAHSFLPMPKRVIADAGYGSEENYLYAIGDDKEPRFEFLIPYNTYVKEKTRKYKRR